MLCKSEMTISERLFFAGYRLQPTATGNAVIEAKTGRCVSQQPRQFLRWISA